MLRVSMGESTIGMQNRADVAKKIKTKKRVEGVTG